MFPKPREDPRVESNDLTCERKNQGKSMIGHGLIVCPGSVENKNAPGRSGVDVYHIEPHAELADGANVRGGIQKVSVNNQVVSAKNQIDLFQCLHKSRFFNP